MAGTIKTNNLQLGDSSTATQNFTLQTNVDGTAKLARGNVGATTQDILMVDAGGKPSFPQGPGAGNTNQSMVRVYTANGYGSTNTKIRRFTTTAVNQGADITYADSATLGGAFTINANGVYAISYSDSFNAASTMLITANDSTPTAATSGVATGEMLAANTASTAIGAGECSWTGYLTAGTVIRAHTEGTPTGSVNFPSFTIQRVA